MALLSTEPPPRAVSRPAVALAVLVAVAAVALAVLIYLDISNDATGSYWAPVAAVFVLIYGAIAASAIVIGDSLLRWLYRLFKRSRQPADRPPTTGTA